MGDAVTQLQDQISLLCSTFCNLSGTLQRDASPAAVGTEPAPSQSSGEGVRAEVGGMAESVVATAKSVDALVKLLPDLQGGEQEAVNKIALLHKENAEVAEELDVELEKAEAQLVALQDMFAALADSKLQNATARR